MLVWLRKDLKGCNEMCLVNGASVVGLDFIRIANSSVPELLGDCTDCQSFARQANFLAREISGNRHLLEIARRRLEVSERTVRRADDNRDTVLARRLELFRELSDFEKRD